MNRIFDRAFEFQIDYRWQSIPELQQALIACISATENARNAEQYIAQIKNKVSTFSDYVRRQSFSQLSQQLVHEIFNTSCSVVKEVGSGFGTISNITYINNRRIRELKIDWTQLKFSDSHGISNEFLPNDFFLNLQDMQQETNSFCWQR